MNSSPKPAAGFLRMVILLVCGIVVGFVLLMAACALPIEPIRQNAYESMVTFETYEGPGEGMKHLLAPTYATTWLDNTTDVRMMMLAIHHSDAPLTYRAAMSLQHVYANMGNLAQDVLMLRDQPEAMQEDQYSRYWHGYLIVLKPLLMWCTYMDIRMINGLAQGALLILLVVQMYKRGLGRYLMAFGISFAMLTPWALALCLQYSTCYYPMMLGMIALLRFDGWIEKRLGFPAFFMLLGMATAYFDFLTYPLVTFGMPAVVWFLLHGEKRNPFPMFVKIGLGWLMGYAGMWLGKWLIVYLFGDKQSVLNAFSALATRTSGDEVSRLSAIGRNLAVYWRKPYKLMALGACAAFAVGFIRAKGRLHVPSAPLALCYALTAALPLAWYFCVAHHSHVHYFFTHRSLCVTAFALLCCLTRIFSPKPENG